MELTFGQLCQALAATHFIPAERATAFAARVKAFQRAGVLPGVNTGRGIAAVYRTEAIVKLVVIFQFVELGMSPELASEMAGEARAEICDAADHTGTLLAQGVEDFDLDRSFRMEFSPGALSDLRGRNAPPEIRTFIARETDWSTVRTQWAVLNLSRALTEFARHLENADVLTLEKFGFALLDWVEAERGRS